VQAQARTTEPATRRAASLASVSRAFASGASIGLAVAGAALAACANAPAGGDAAVLEDVDWALVELDGRLVDATEDRPTLRLVPAEQRASGFAGCNRFSGGYEHEGERLRLGPLAATRMYCARMELETAYLRALDATRRFRVEGDVLELLGEPGAPGGAALARLRPAPAAGDAAP
jgi:heat shock protein HslJ